MEIITGSAKDTVKLGEQIGKKVSPGAVIALFGELGAGKTTLVQGIAKGLGISDHVTSPSFVLISEFKGRIDLCHIDFYRMEDGSEIEELGIEDYLSKENTVCVIEWAEKMGGLLPEDSIRIKIEPISENERRFFIEGLDLK